jgi:hypothetical protein
MEFLLLWADNLDDAFHAFRHRASKLVGLLLALSLFALTGIALLRTPHGALGAIALVLSAALVDGVRRRRYEQLRQNSE